jgi:hypothetical protein
MRRLRQQSGTVILFLVMAVLLSYPAQPKAARKQKNFFQI